MGNHRVDKINEEFRRALGEILREVKDPRIPALCSVTHVSVTPDLKYAKVHVSFLGKGDPEQCLSLIHICSFSFSQHSRSFSRTECSIAIFSTSSEAGI